MEITVHPSKLNGTVRAVCSKSHVHRLLICAALSDKPVTILCPTSSDDIDATGRCLCALGAGITRFGGGYYVTPIKTVVKDALLDCNESGSTMRFLLPVAAALGIDAKFYMAGRLPERPIVPLTEELSRHGCRFKYDSRNILHCTGRLTSGVYTIPGNVSSQYISGLLFALPLVSGDSVIKIDGQLESAGYVQMTCNALSGAGVAIREEDGVFYITGSQRYHLPDCVSAEGDWSNASFLLAMGALSDGCVTCTGLNHTSSQLDKRIVRLLRRFGAEVKTSHDSAVVTGGKLTGITVNAADIPDLVPVLAVLAAKAEGVTKITHAQRLRMKESDRLHSTAQLITALGGNVREYSDRLVITGSGSLNGGTVDSFGDHRIAMTAACASLICKNSVTITNAQSVTKSYPTFWDDFADLGAEIYRTEA